MSSTGGKETLSDVLTYLGTITYEGFGQIVHAVSSNPETRDRNVVLVLVTAGGNPHAAFRIVRFLQSSYRTVTAFVPGLCKSAGTLLCIGANEISITETGELGPLDVQVQKPSELIGYSSGLAIPQSLAFLEASASGTLNSVLRTLIVDQGLGPEKAAEIAIQTTVGLYQPIYQQIDPLRIGEITREQAIAEDYAKRLRPEIPADALGRLVSGYSSHAFVIDRSEAVQLLQNVREPNQFELSLAATLGPDIWRLPHQPPSVTYDKARKEEPSVTQTRDAAEPSAEGRADQEDRPSAAGNGSPPLVGEPTTPRPS